MTLLADVAAAVLDHGRVPRDTPPRMLKTMRSLAAVVDLYLPSRAEFLTVWEAETSDAAASQALHAGERDDRVVAVTARPGSRRQRPRFAAAMRRTPGPEAARGMRAGADWLNGWRVASVVRLDCPALAGYGWLPSATRRSGAPKAPDPGAAGRRERLRDRRRGRVKGGSNRRRVLRLVRRFLHGFVIQLHLDRQARGPE